MVLYSTDPVEVDNRFLVSLLDVSCIILIERSGKITRDSILEVKELSLLDFLQDYMSIYDRDFNHLQHDLVVFDIMDNCIDVNFFVYRYDDVSHCQIEKEKNCIV